MPEIRYNERMERILFFDGVCNLCNASVDFLVRQDPGGLIRYAPLQGKTAAARLRMPAPVSSDELETVVYWENGRSWIRSSAALRVLAALGGPWALVKLLLLIPAPIRDAAYRIIARNRYRWFGRRETCRLPTPEERARFLD